MMGLRASLKSILDEGLENKKERMVRYGTMIRTGLANMGLRNLVDDEYSPLLTKVVFPDGIDREEARDFIRYHYGILVGIEFRIAHFGAGVDEDSITLILTGIEDFLRRKGIDLPAGVCLKGLDAYRPRKKA
jgi:aspartate aminotransferase-like enzyme